MADRPQRFTAAWLDALSHVHHVAAHVDLESPSAHSSLLTRLPTPSATPAPLSALQSERSPWTGSGAPWPTTKQHRAAPTNLVLLFLASRCSSAPSPRSRGRLQADASGAPAAGPLLLQPAAAWPGAGHSWPRLGRLSLPAALGSLPHRIPGARPRPRAGPLLCLREVEEGGLTCI